MLFVSREVGMTQQQRDIKRKLAVLEYAQDCANVARTCRHFGISRQCYYNWLRAYERRGEAGLVNRGPCPENHSLRTPKPIEEKIVHLRLTHHFGPTRIAWYLGRYHGFSISTHGVYNVLVRNAINRLPTSCHKRSMPSKRYQKQVPGHHVQVDVMELELTRSR
jgi:transposase-like protein